MSLQAVTTGGAFSRNTCFQPGAGAHGRSSLEGPCGQRQGSFNSLLGWLNQNKISFINIAIMFDRKFPTGALRWLSP